MRSESRIRELLEYADATDFSYDHSVRSFSIGQRHFDIVEASNDSRLFNPQPEYVETNERTMLVSARIFGTVMYPRMYDWLSVNLDDRLSRDTVEVMQDVFSDLRVDLDRSRLRSGSGLFGFAMNRLRKEHPHISLAVLGNCACMGVSVDGIIGQQEWSTKFAAFEMHNIDSPEQRVSIMAGLGHLGHKATRADRKS